MRHFVHAIIEFYRAWKEGGFGVESFVDDGVAACIKKTYKSILLHLTSGSSAAMTFFCSDDSTPKTNRYTFWTNRSFNTFRQLKLWLGSSLNSSKQISVSTDEWWLWSCQLLLKHESAKLLFWKRRRKWQFLGEKINIIFRQTYCNAKECG